MSQTLDYPGDEPTGPQTAVLPDGAPHTQQGPQQHGPQQPGPQAYSYRPGAPVPPQASQNFQSKPNRLNKIAASVCIAAGSLVIIAVLFGGGFYLGRETAPGPAPRAEDRSAARLEQGGPMIIPMPRGQFEQPGPGGIVIPNGPTIQLPNIFPQFPSSPQNPSPQIPGQPPR